MRWILLALTAVCLGGWIYIGSTAALFGLPVPALGDFYHPSRGFWRNADAKLAFAPNGKLSIEHPLAKGTIHYDERSVPHIFTENLEQALFLQGFITARDRLWQMDISTRSTGGELAEVLGAQVVSRDQKQIRNGYRAAAELAVNTWKTQFPEDFALVESYCAGVNAYISQLDPIDYPVEYKLLNYTPRRWTPYHTALMLKGMTQSMTDRSDDAEFTYALEKLGRNKFDEYFPKWYPKQTPIIPSGTKFDLKNATPRKRSELPIKTGNQDQFSTATSLAKPLMTQNLPERKEARYWNDYRSGNGSNNWAIAGSKSITHKPILAGDPHLGLSLPSIWYEIQLHTSESNCRGVSLPGLPLIVIGYNESIAWSMTNGSEDVVDWYRMDWTDEKLESYRIGDEVIPVVTRQDTLRIKGEAPKIIATKWTERGPVPDLNESSPHYALAKDATYLYTQTDRPAAELTTMRRMMAAKNYTDFKAAMRSYSEPIMNFAYADKHGDIAILANGFWPLRNSSSSTDETSVYPGLTISDGSRAEPNWTSYLPFEHLPEQYNPKRGFVSSANQPPTDEAFPYLYYGRFPTWRGRYINRKLAQGKRLSHQEMKALQQDAHSIMAEELLPLLLARINRKQLTNHGLHWFTELAEWDYDYVQNNRAASFFEAWRKKVYMLTVDELDEEKGYPNLPQWRWIELLRRSPRHELFDIKETDNRETAATLTQRAFDELLEEDEDVSFPVWVEERNSTLNHIGRIPGLGAGALLTNGHWSSPNAVSGTHGPSWRMVVELGDQARGWGVLPGGASGNPGATNYQNGVEEWSRGRYFDLVFWPDESTAARKSTNTLTFE